jgi:hypothetical protein
MLKITNTTTIINTNAGETPLSLLLFSGSAPLGTAPLSSTLYSFATSVHIALYPLITPSA